MFAQLSTSLYSVLSGEDYMSEYLSTDFIVAAGCSALVCSYFGAILFTGVFSFKGNRIVL